MAPFSPIPNHKTLPDLPSADIADHTGYLDLGGTRALTNNLVFADNDGYIGSDTTNALLQFAATSLVAGGDLNMGGNDIVNGNNLTLGSGGLISFGGIESIMGNSAGNIVIGNTTAIRFGAGVDATFSFVFDGLTSDGTIAYNSTTDIFDISSDLTALSITADQLTLTKAGTSTAVDTGPLLINAVSATTNSTLFGIEVAGVDKLRIDEQGDIYMLPVSGGNKMVTSGNFDFQGINNLMFMMDNSDTKTDRTIRFRHNGNTTIMQLSETAIGGSEGFMVSPMRFGDSTSPNAANAIEVNGVSIFGDGGITNFTQMLATGDIIQAGSATAFLQGLGVNTVRVTGSPYTVLATDDEIFVDTDGGAITVNLPVGVNGKRYRIINTGSSGNDVTVAPNGAELLTGANASRTLSDSSVIILTYETTEGWW